MLRDQAGTGKILKRHGFNLGGWLFQESWMSPNLVNDPAALVGQSGMLGEYCAASTAGPGLGMRGANYSVKWKGWISAPNSGTWTITETSDDAFGVYVDGVLVVDDWLAHGSRG